MHNLTYQIFSNPRVSYYYDLTISNSGAVGHLEFYLNWILTIGDLRRPILHHISNFSTIGQYMAELLMITHIFLREGEFSSPWFSQLSHHITKYQF